MEQQQPGVYIKSLKILHTALLVGQILFLAVMIFLVSRGIAAVVSPSLDKILQVAVLLLSFGGVFFSSSIFKKKLMDINSNAGSAVDKANQYRAANIVRWAMVEGPSLFVIICFFLTGNYSFAALSLALILFFIMIGPSRIKAMLHLQMSEQEVDELK